MNTEELDRLMHATREIAPLVEAAVARVRDPAIRAAIAGAVMLRALSGVPEAARSKEPVGRGGGPAGAPQAPARGTQGRVLALQADGFFAEPRSIEQVMQELKIRGYHHNKSDLRMSLLRLARKKVLRRIPFGGQGRQQVFYYVNP